MYYSYVMGIGKEIDDLKNEGFIIEPIGNDYGISFPREKAQIWEDFIEKHLERNYWNEYLTDDGVVFLFHLDNGIKRYYVENYTDDEVLSLCEKLFGGKFPSIKEMLLGNSFYKDKMKHVIEE